MIKTLIYTCNGKHIAVLVRGDHDINDEKLTQAVGGEHIELSDEATIADITSAAVGFAGPVEIVDKVDMMLVDHSVAAMIAGVTGANKTDYHVTRVVPVRDFPLDGDKVKVMDVRNACEGDTYEGKKLLFRRGIEVGQVFKLGTKYSKKLGANFQGKDGKEAPCLMGCYGIGINRIMASSIELGNDENGIIWPISIAPWEVIITLAGQSDEIKAAGEEIYSGLMEKGVEVLIDDRQDVRPGVKFKDADLLGVPVRVTIGQGSIAEGKVEIKLRSETDAKKVSVESAVDEVIRSVNPLKAKLNCKS